MWHLKVWGTLIQAKLPPYEESLGWKCNVCQKRLHSEAGKTTVWQERRTRNSEFCVGRAGCVKVSESSALRSLTSATKSSQRHQPSPPKGREWGKLVTSAACCVRVECVVVQPPQSFLSQRLLSRSCNSWWKKCKEEYSNTLISLWVLNFNEKNIL